MSSRGAPPQRGRQPNRSVTPQGKKAPPKSQNDTDVEIMEFLEGLLEGFRAAAAANAAQGNTGPRQPKWFEAEGNRGGDWSDLNELEKTLPVFSKTELEKANGQSRSVSPISTSARPAAGGKGGSTFKQDPLSTLMRRHALRAFLEEMCGSVAKAFEQMATLAVKNSLGSQGGIGLPEQRMKYKFGPQEFQQSLSQMEYGVGAGSDWWHALFQSIDVDQDGAVSLQDMYDALVLDLPPMAGASLGGGGRGAASTVGSVFFPGMDDRRSPRASRPASPGQFSPASRGGPSLNTTIDTRQKGAGYRSLGAFEGLDLDGLFNNDCRVCGADLTNDMIICRTCGTRRVKEK